MRLSVILTVLVALSLAVGSLALAEEQVKQDSSAAEPAALKNQTRCPVMGGKIDSTVYTDIQGQRVYHCCPMCSGKLRDDPDKYFQKAAAEGVLFENIQVTCPVSGEELETKDIYTDFEGRRIYFCCMKCLGTFSKDPQKFLKKMDQARSAEEKEKKGREMPMGHGANDEGGNDH